MSDHEIYMQRCISLATQGIGVVSPNPMVGAVIVCDGKVIGEGYHEHYGAPHAEVNAIQAVLHNFPDGNERLKRSVLYVNLEPCAHFGKTPPCANLIIDHNIPYVVIGCRDPFEQVNGKGIEKLEAAGTHVLTGILEKECLDVNKRFFMRVQHQRPYIILKWAQTTDGFFAPDDRSQKWISSHESKRLVHQWRSEEDAVLIGKGTAIADNPQLNVRECKGRNPVRIVIDRNLELPNHLYLFDQSQKTLVFNELKTETSGNIKYLQPDDFDNYLPQMIAYQLYMMDIQSVIIEGGAQTLQMFIDHNLWDEARIFTSPERWEKGIRAPEITLPVSELINIGPDKLTIQYNTP